MNNDLIKRGLAISYAVSGIVRKIDGEEWIRRSDVRQSLNDVPTEPQDCSDCKRYDSPYFEVTIDKEQLQELVDKAKAEVLASIESPQGEWIIVDDVYCECPFCKNKEVKFSKYCPKCGARLKGGAE